MTPQELKSSILQLAIQGKLVEQRPEEGTGEELYRQIQAEKQKLIEEGKIKKEKTLPEITEDEIPFEIPESWKWVRIGSLLYKLVDGTHKTPKYTTRGVPFVSVRNMSNGHLSLDDTKFITEEEHRELRNRCNPQRGDILLSKVGTTGIPAKVDTDEEFSLFVSVALLKFNNILLNIDFLIYSILAPDFQKQCREHTRGVGNKNWVVADIANTIMPFPPLSEQKRIVAKIEELLPLIERYEKAWSRLEDFNKRFPGDMQKSILQMAIQGKLVEQRPEEGTGEELYRQIQAEKQALIKAGKIKKEKPLPEITEDEIPFDIPESWKWCRLNDVSLMIGDIDHKMPPTVEAGGIPYISPLNFTKEGGIDYSGAKHISFNDFVQLGKKCTPSKNDIIFPRYGTIGVIRIVETDQPFLASYSCCTIKSLGNDSMLYKYVFYVLKSHLIQNEINRYINKTTQPNVGLQSIKQFLFPLPPLAEQKRIVAKLEEILPLCERLK